MIEFEQIALDLLRDENGYEVRFGPDLAEGATKERDYGEVVLQERLQKAIDRLNPSIPAGTREAAGMAGKCAPSAFGASPKCDSLFRY